MKDIDCIATHGIAIKKINLQKYNDKIKKRFQI